jgi:hypothetical protein
VALRCDVRNIWSKALHIIGFCLLDSRSFRCFKLVANNILSAISRIGTAVFRGKINEALGGRKEFLQGQRIISVFPLMFLVVWR